MQHDAHIYFCDLLNIHSQNIQFSMYKTHDAIATVLLLHDCYFSLRKSVKASGKIYVRQRLTCKFIPVHGTLQCLTSLSDLILVRNVLGKKRKHSTNRM